MAPAPPNSQQRGQFQRFWSAWFRNPGSIGAVAPSSAGLAKAMLAAVNDNLPAGAIVELGAGTGPITREIIAQLPGRKLYILEKDAQLAERLQRQWPAHSVITGSAEQLPELLPANAPVAAVISSLPLLNMPLQVRRQILSAAFAVMPHSTARMSQFTYGMKLPFTPEHLHTSDLRAERQKRIWLNMPPAAVWRITRR